MATNTQPKSNRRSRVVFTAIIALGAFAISSVHWFHVAQDAGNAWWTAAIYPVAIDCLIIVSAMTMMQSTGVTRMAKYYASLGRAFGFAATLYGNMAASHFTSASDMLVNLMPAVALILSVEMLIASAKATSTSRARAATPRKRSAPKATTAKHANVTAIPAKLRAVKP